MLNTAQLGSDLSQAPVTILEATQRGIIAAKQVSGQHRLILGERAVAVVDGCDDVSRISNKPVYASEAFW